MPLEITSGIKNAPFKVLMYGKHGVGKSTWASMAPNAFVIDPNERTRRINFHKRVSVTSWDEVVEAVELVVSGEVECDTIVLDELATLERLNHEHVCKRGKKNDISDFKWGAGYSQSLKDFRNLLGLLDKSGKNVILIGHTHVSVFKNPEGEDYNEYQVDCRDKLANMICQWAEAVFFARHLKYIEKTTDDQKKIVVQDEKPILHTVEDAAYTAKNSYGMRPKISMDFREFELYLEAVNMDSDALIEVAEEHEYKTEDLDHNGLKQLYVHIKMEEA